MIGWIDAQAGASGDMLLGAVVDAGVPLAVLQDAVGFLGVTLTANPTTRASLGATKVDVSTPPAQETRTWADVRAMLPEGRSHEVFERLAHAEGAVHRIPADEVHFHEVGALDALADIIGVTAGFAHLGLTELHCSTVALGSGTTRGAHGPLPVPAPAVLVLLDGKPVHGGASPHEATTPTGAALLATLVTHWGPLPPMNVARTGLGAGGRDPAEVANVVRLVLGNPLQGKGSAVLLETNVDDLDPRLWPHVLTQLMASGASDAWLTPILMKKGRPAHTLSVLCSPEQVAQLRAVVFRETSTLGLRESTVAKHALERRESTVEVGGHLIRVKVASLDGEVVNTNPEWEDVLAAAQALGRPAKEVLQSAVTKASAPAPPTSGTATTS
ncbi:MAG: uncharacterized protein JWO12_1526 [Frankiales bacterium]|nr:uncharacterized protein [Frankiales bacterium]